MLPCAVITALCYYKWLFSSSLPLIHALSSSTWEHNDALKWGFSPTCFCPVMKTENITQQIKQAHSLYTFIATCKGGFSLQTHCSSGCDSRSSSPGGSLSAMHLMQGFTAGCVSHQVKWPADMADGDSCKQMPLTSYTASLREKMSLIVASFENVFNAPVTAALQPAAHPQQHEGLCSVWSWSISRDVLKIMHFGPLAEFLHAKQASNPASDLLLPPPIQAQAGTRETLPWWQREDHSPIAKDLSEKYHGSQNILLLNTRAARRPYSSPPSPLLRGLTTGPKQTSD